MKHAKLVVAALIVSLVASVCCAAEPPADSRAACLKMYHAGNYRDAYEGFRKLALDPKDDPMQVGQDLDMATNALVNLNRVNEIDDFREAVIAAHKDNWRLLFAAAQNCLRMDSQGFMIAGKFERGPHRGGGRYVNSSERDRVRALQLMTQAQKKITKNDGAGEVGNFYLAFANMYAQYRGYSQAWRLQYLTDLSKLPDYDEGYGYYYYGGRDTGAPVNPDGTPVYYYVPKTYDEAKNDGERWRWLLFQTMEVLPARKNEVRKIFADFLWTQFGVQTMARYSYYFRGFQTQDDDTKKDESGTYALHTLGEDETIARLATGIKRFKLPDEFNFIKQYQQIADDGKLGWGEQALNQLAQVFENRRQYDKAADYWQRNIKEYGPGGRNWKQQRLNQIIGNWGMFEPIMTQPAGRGATIEYRFRNGKKVTFEAHEILVKMLRDDVIT